MTHAAFYFWPAGLPVGQAMAVRDLWTHKDLGTHATGFSVGVAWHDARIYKLTKA